MSQQALDLRRSVQIVRRHKKIFGSVLALGILIGAAYGVLKPPMLTSTALVVLPESAALSSSGTNPIIATQVVIASSDAVLAGALPHASPAMTLQQLQDKIQVANPAGSILSISATGGTAAQAEATANAVANSYVAYASSSSSPVGHVSATILEPATTATGTKLSEQVLIYALLGALGGAIVGFVISVAVGRNNKRLVERDAIANSIAAPVLASIPVSRPSDATSWARLFDEYEPEAVDAWALNTVLQRLGVTDFAAGNHGRAGGFSLTVLSLASDPTALALGPQLASFAALLGIPTALVIGPQQDVNVTATLHTACAAPSQPTAGRRRPLRVVATDDTHLGQLRAPFTVVVAVVDGEDPLVSETVRTTATVLGVSAGAATAAQLARATAAAAADSREVLGILVANPDPDDQTTGRVPRLAPPLRRQLPTRANGVVPMEIRQ